MGLILALMFQMFVGLVFAAQATAVEAVAGDGAATAGNVKVTAGNGSTKVTVNGQEVHQSNGTSTGQQQKNKAPLDGLVVTVNDANNTASVDVSKFDDCTVADGATITIQDDDANVTAADEVTVTADADTDIKFKNGEILITDTSGDGIIPTGSALTPPLTVKSSTGITCKTAAAGGGGGGGGNGASANAGGGGGAEAGIGGLTCGQIARIIQDARDEDAGDEDSAVVAQYSAIAQNCTIQGGDVIADTIPKGTLADTGGPSLALLVASLLLVGGGLLLRATLRR